MPVRLKRMTHTPLRVPYLLRQVTNGEDDVRVWHKTAIFSIHQPVRLVRFLGWGIALSAVCMAGFASPTAVAEHLHANSNQIPAGVVVSGVLTIDLEVREGEWFPEDENGPSIKVFAL